MKSLIRIVAVAAVAAIAFTSTSFAAKEKGAKAGKTAVPVFAGLVDALDVAANTLTVKKGEESKTIAVNGETKIATADKKEAALADLKVGDKVVVQYVEVDGKLTAKSIKATVSKEKKKK